jgi:hypothetical protein
MSCDNSTNCTAVVDLGLRYSCTIELGDAHATTRKTDLEADKQSRSGRTADRSKSKGWHEVQSRIIPDCTETDPEYVWGDEGPFND